MEMNYDLSSDELQRLKGDDEKLGGSYDELLDRIDRGEIELKDIGNVT
jgi:hypothetical protein